jgi:GNAT superfamily N-acetyltransferase
MEPTVREATPADAEELTRLRAIMLRAMRIDVRVDVPGDEWRAACVADFRLRLSRDDAVAFVIDQEVPGLLASCAIGLIRDGLPSPERLHGRTGVVLSVATDENYRGRGYATAIVSRLLGWFTERGITTVDLHATPYGLPIYRRLGFTEPRFPAMSWNR